MGMIFIRSPEESWYKSEFLVVPSTAKQKGTQPRFKSKWSGYIEWTTLCGGVAHILLLLYIFEIALNDKSNGQLRRLLDCISLIFKANTSTSWV